MKGTRSIYSAPKSGGHLSGQIKAIEEGEAILIVGVAAIAVIVGMGFAGLGPLGSLAHPTTSSGSSGTYAYKYSDAGYGGASLTSPSASVYSVANGYQLSTDAIGSLSSAVTSSGSYSTGQLSALVTATGAYPIYAPLDGQAHFLGPVQVLAPATLAQGAVAGQQVALQQFTSINAPASGTSATTNVLALVTSADGSALAGGGHATDSTISETPVQWTAALNILSANAGACYQENVISTPSAPVVSYANGGSASVPYGQTQNFGCELIIAVNDTSMSINLSAGQSGLSMQAITFTGQTANTQAWVVTGFNGCTPAAQAGTLTCAKALFDVNEKTDVDAGHVGIAFIFVDMQQADWVIHNLTEPAVTSWAADGSHAGLPSSFAGILVPTTGPDSGAPTVLIEQYFGVVANL